MHKEFSDAPWFQIGVWAEVLCDFGGITVVLIFGWGA